MNVSLTPALEAFIRKKVEGGLYNNASEVVREALRLLVDREGASRAPSAPPRADVAAALAKLEQALRARGVRSLAVLGSVARDATSANDIDVLVDVDPSARFGLVDLSSLKNFLEASLGHAVDVVTREGLHPSIRDRVLAEVRRVF